MGASVYKAAWDEQFWAGWRLAADSDIIAGLGNSKANLQDLIFVYTNL